MVLLVLRFLVGVAYFLLGVAATLVFTGLVLAARSDAPMETLAVLVSRVRAAFWLTLGAILRRGGSFRPLRRAAIAFYERAMAEPAWLALSPEHREHTAKLCVKERLLARAFVRIDASVADDGLTHVFLSPDKPRTACGCPAHRGSILCMVDRGLPVEDETSRALHAARHPCPGCVERVQADEESLAGMAALHGRHLGNDHSLFRWRDPDPDAGLFEVFFSVTTGFAQVLIRRDGHDLLAGDWGQVRGAPLIEELDGSDEGVARAFAAMDRATGFTPPSHGECQCGDGEKDQGDMAEDHSAVVTLSAETYYRMTSRLAARKIAAVAAEPDLPPAARERLLACVSLLGGDQPDAEGRE